MASPNRWKRFDDWDERPLRLDRFAVEDARNGFAAFSSPADPRPGLAIEGGRVTTMDGVPEAASDMIDRFVARHPGFSLLSAADTLARSGLPADARERLSAATLQTRNGIVLSPRRTGTDGFFVALLQRSA